MLLNFLTLKLKLFLFPLVFILCATINSVAQGVNSYWCFGYTGLTTDSNFSGTNIRFKNDSLFITRKNRKMQFFKANASMAAENGALKFYTNGYWIANALEDTMQNGSRLHRGIASSNSENPNTQAALILPFPGDSNKFYVFHYWGDVITAYTILPLKAYYTVVDMSLNNGLGAVISKNNIAINDTLSEYGLLTACKHANGRDWWLIAPKYHSNKYHVCLITPAGVQAMPDQAVGTPPSGWYQGYSQAVFSPDGTKYARFDGIDHLHLYNFDRCDGTLSNDNHISFPADTFYAGGVSFSPNSSKLYVSASDYLLQFDLTQTNIAASCDTVATYDGYYDTSFAFPTRFYLHQIAPDGKIYINTPSGTRYLHVINNPDSAGNACNVIQHGIRLKTFNAFSIPNHPNYYLGADSGSVCDTLQLGTNGAQLKATIEKVNVFPNPVQDYLQVNYTPNNYVKTLQIIDVNGKVILDRKLAQYSQFASIDASKFLAGIYLCKIIYLDKSVTCKFVKE
jgi:hypothetical protein